MNANISTFVILLFYSISFFKLNEVEAGVKRRRHQPTSVDATNKGVLEDLGKSVLNFLKLPATCQIFNDVGKNFDEQFPKDYTVKFYHTTRSSRDRIAFEKSDGKYIRDKLDFDTSKRTAVIVHGFQSSGDVNWMKDLTDAFLLWGDVNVIVVDWSAHAKTLDYVAAARHTRQVGKEIATFIGEIIDVSSKSKNSLGVLHLLGHSLGAHVVGIASNEIRDRKLKWQVQRVTAFDPAQPCFDGVALEVRLDKSDAPFVDAIHTSAKALIKGGLGIWEPVGHLDFYPNGGQNQPGCENKVKFYDKDALKKLSDAVVCNHGMSYNYFIDSLKQASNGNCVLWAFKWNQNFDDLPSSIDTQSICKGNNNKDLDSNNSCVPMGINAEKYKTDKDGAYYVETGKQAPFCKTRKSLSKMLLNAALEKTLHRLVKSSKKRSKRVATSNKSSG